MTKTPIKLTFEEYLTYHNHTDDRYDLVDGDLVAITPPSPDYVAIIKFI